MKTNYTKLLKTAIKYLNYRVNEEEPKFKVEVMKTEFGYSIWIVNETKKTLHICRCENAKNAYKMVMTFIDGYIFGYSKGRNK